MSPWDQELFHHCQGRATDTKVVALLGTVPAYMASTFVPAWSHSFPEWLPFMGNVMFWGRQAGHKTLQVFIQVK